MQFILLWNVSKVILEDVIQSMWFCALRYFFDIMYIHGLLAISLVQPNLLLFSIVSYQYTCFELYKSGRRFYIFSWHFSDFFISLTCFFIIIWVTWVLQIFFQFFFLLWYSFHFYLIFFNLFFFFDFILLLPIIHLCKKK